MLNDKHGNPLSTTQVVSKIINRLYNYLADFGLMVIRWVGHIPLHHIRRFVYRLSGMTIGHGSTIHMFATFFSLKTVTIGEDTIIGNRIFIDGRDRVTIGNHVDIASEVMIYNSHHDLQSPEFTAITAPVTIEDYVFIGPRAIILPGVTIGKGAVVAAGAVVSKDVTELTIVGGVPAKQISRRNLKQFNYKLGRARWFQ